MAKSPEELRNNPRTLRMGIFERMPILGTTKVFITLNQSTLCTVETHDISGAVRGAVAIGLSNHDVEHGFAIYSSIEEAEALVALLQNGIDDAKRIEAGVAPYAQEGVEPPRKH